MQTDSVMKILNETDVIRHIQQSGDSKKLLDFLAKGYDFKPSMEDTRYNLAKFRYGCGNFSRVFSLSILIMKRGTSLSARQIPSSEKMSRKRTGQGDRLWKLAPTVGTNRPGPDCRLQSQSSSVRVNQFTLPAGTLKRCFVGKQ